MSPKSHWKEYRSTFCATLVTATAGTCFGWASPTVFYLKSNSSHIKTSDDQRSWIVSVMILFSAITPIPSAYFADRFGRKTALLVGAIPFIIGWALVIGATTVGELYAARAFCGLGYGVVYTVAPMYTGEIATDEVRGALSTLITLMNKLGILMQYCIGPYVDMKTLATINLTLPVLFLATFMWLPESPYYYAKCERLDQAEDSLKRLRNGDVRNELKTIEINVQEDMRNRASWGDLFLNITNRKTLIVILGIFTVQQWCGSAAVVAYAQNIFEDAHGSLKPHEESMILGCVQVATASVSFLLVDKLGRKPLLLASSLGVAVTNVIIGAYFLYSKTNGYSSVTAVKIIPLIAILIYIVAYAIGLSTVPYVIIAEMFPTNIKSLASCVAHIYTGISMFAVQKLFQVCSDGIGIQYVFFSFSAFSLAGLVFILIYLPETKGKSFATIQCQLRRDSIRRKSIQVRTEEI